MRVIVATDGSADAMAAVEWTRLLPLPTDATFLVVSAVPPAALPALPDWDTEARSAQVRAAQDAMDGAARHLAGSVECRLLEDDPREGILAVATEQAADLVVMGARGLSAVKEFFLGSVSLHIARHAPCAVLVCKGGPRPLRTITIAHDGSAGARAAVRFVAALPLAPATHFRVIGVASAVHYPSTAPDILGAALRDAVAHADAERRRTLREALTSDVACLRGGVAIDVTVTVGQPAPKILHYASTTDTDLLVVGARGLGTIKRLALGSVSESVLRHAVCPVLVVRGAV